MTSAIRARREAEDGFTLIELLVVVIIIGILAAIAIPAFLNQRERAWQSELTSTVRNVALEVEARATQSGGVYTGAGGAFPDLNTTAGTSLQAFLNTNVTELQGTANNPVTLVAQSLAADNFEFCGWHAQIDGDGNGTAENDHNVQYDSNGDTATSKPTGVQDFTIAACA